jgi:hypothetical protein
VSNLDRLATTATGIGFTPTLGYGLARPSQLPAAAWVHALAFAFYDPTADRHPNLRVCWAVLRWPATLLRLSWRRVRRGLFVYPTRGRPRAVGAIAPPISWAHVVGGFSLVAVFVLIPTILWARHDGPVPVVDPIAGALVRFVAPVIPVATWLGLIVTIVVATSLLTHLLLLLSNPASRTKAPPISGAALELSDLAAWPERTGHGFDLFDAVLADLERQMPEGTTLMLTPGAPWLRARYRARGFTELGVAQWRTRTTGDPANPPGRTRPLSCSGSCCSG